MRIPLPLLSAKPSLRSLLLTMPTDKPHVPKLKAVRKLKKIEMTKYAPGTINLQVLGNSLYLFTDQSRYLFNCSEGTQRLAHEHKQKLAKLDHVFLTSGRWERVGGLPGVALTVQDIGVDRIWVHGPPGVSRLFTTARRFIILKDLEVSTVNTCHAGPYSDHILKINYINVTDGTDAEITAEKEDDTTDYYSSYRASHGEKMISVKSDEAVLQKNVAVQYGIHLEKKEGTLLIDKCVAKGVPPGPLLGRLKAGEDVTLENGTVVRAEDVRAGDCVGAVILVLDCPSLSHLKNFTNSPQLLEYAQEKKYTHTVVHFTPLEILQSPEYQEFMGKFHLSTQHLLINDKLLTDANEAVHRMQTKLNLIDDKLFPLFQIKEKVKFSLPFNTIIGETGMKIGLRGKLGVEDPTWSITPEKYRSEFTSNEDFTTELALFKESQPKSTSESESKLIFLGTGSSIPNKTRNVSSFYLEIDSENGMLFDCGEGTFQQLERFPNFQDLISKLKIIYISHLHADHHLGLFSFLSRKMGQKITVIAPAQISSWLSSYSSNFQDLDYNLFPCDQFLEISQEIVGNSGLKSLRTCFVRHCPNAFGVSVVIGKSGKKITYSGDTMPSSELILLGKDSDILVHEATMEDGLEKEAVMKQHSTCGQAIEVGSQMGAKFTILTHFSQRYSKIPLLEGDVGVNVGVAFDGLVVGVEDVGKLGGMGRVLSSGWREDVEEMEEKRVKRGRLKGFEEERRCKGGA